MSAESNSISPSLLTLRLVGELEEIGRLQVERQPIPEGLRASLARTVKEYRRITHGHDAYAAAVHYWDCERRLDTFDSIKLSSEE